MLKKLFYPAVFTPEDDGGYSVAFPDLDGCFTQGETIEWGTNEISGTIMRDDTEDHQWKKISSIMDSEADAEAAIKQFLSIAGEP